MPLKFPEKSLLEKPKVLKRIKNRKLKKSGTLLPVSYTHLRAHETGRDGCYGNKKITYKIKLKC